MSQNKRTTLAIIANLILAGIDFLVVLDSSRNMGWRLIRFYTEDSNILVILACLMMAYFEYQKLKNKKEIPQWAFLMKYCSVCCIMVTFLVVVFILSPMMGGYKAMMFTGNMLYLHNLCPLLALFIFVVLEKDNPLGKDADKKALLPTVLYAIIFITLNILKIEDGPYPFLRVYNQPIWMSCLWFVLIVGGAYLVALGIKKMHQIVKKKMNKQNL